MFSPSARLEYRWHNLVFLAFPNVRFPPDTQTLVLILGRMNTPRLSAANFKLVTVLALVECIVNSHGSLTAQLCPRIVDILGRHRKY